MPPELQQRWLDEPTTEQLAALQALPDDHPVTADVVEQTRRAHEVIEALERELVALREVKERIRAIAALLVVDRLRRSVGLVADPPTLHMCFTGNPGTGKTTVARRMGQILFHLGYVRKGHLVVASREDLVGQYVGHTAPKTREVVNRAMGGVLFIDEAYMLYRQDNERDYGIETVEILLDVMENQRHDIVVIFAGYRDKMERFFADAPGLRSRIGHHLHFPDYSLEELMAIADLMVAESNYRLSPSAREALRRYLDRRMRQPHFANGRSVRNAIERARLRQAVRIWQALEAGRTLTKGELLTIEAEDITASRVFEEPVLEATGG